MKVLGIDLGTTFSSAAIVEDGKPIALKSSTGISQKGDSYSIPSSVFVEENGDITLGQAAESKRKSDPERFKKEFKRNLGECIPYQLGNKSFLPQDLMKEFIKHFKKIGEEAIGGQFDKVAITCPANFKKHKRELIRNAASKAGIYNVEILEEPTAAAIYYSSKEKIQVGEKILVYDLGGGTFDVSLIKKEKEGFSLLTAPLGIESCGGIDFDKMIFSKILGCFKQEFEPILSKGDINSRRLLLSLEEKVLEVKHMLSSVEEANTSITVGIFDYKEFTLSRNEFNGMIHSLVEETCKLIKDIVKNARLTMKEVDKVLLIGGSSRIPYVREMVEKTTEKNIMKDADPDLAVCYGAATAIWKEDNKAEILDELYKTGLCYYFGKEGKNKDYKKAVDLFNKAAEGGHVDAQYALGDCYENGEGVVQNYNQAVYWYKKAAEKEDANAQNRLGKLYYNGKGVIQDYNEAGVLWEKAARKGQKNAIENLELLKKDNNGKYVISVFK